MELKMIKKNEKMNLDVMEKLGQFSSEKNTSFCVD